jgi:formate dehydrogenase maturation protein FdhE
MHDTVRARGHATIDVARARARIRAGRPAFDTIATLESAGDMRRLFERAAAAFERTGIATTTQRTAMQKRAADANTLVESWAHGDSTPRDMNLRMARSVAGVVGNAILSRVAADVTLRFRLSAWKRLDCPCCGASPDLAIVTDARRSLVCWRCDTTWRTEHRGCLGCGEDEPPALVRVPSLDLGYNLAICNSCGRYLKERRGTPKHPLIVERALTAGLDEAAQQRGLRA